MRRITKTIIVFTQTNNTLRIHKHTHSLITRGKTFKHKSHCNLLTWQSFICSRWYSKLNLSSSFSAACRNLVTSSSGTSDWFSSQETHVFDRIWCFDCPSEPCFWCFSFRKVGSIITRMLQWHKHHFSWEGTRNIQLWHSFKKSKQTWNM